MARNKLTRTALLWLAMAALSPAADNPFLRATDAMDSGTLKYNGEYFMTGNWMSGNMYSSRDLVNWGNRKQVITHVGGWATTPSKRYADAEIHASDPNYINGVFHLYFQVDDKIGHAVATSPWGPYTEPVPATAFAGRIDAEYFRDDNGNQYFYTVQFPGTGNVIYSQSMTDPWTLSGSATSRLTAIAGTWENPSGTNINEGPKVLKYRSRYYMLYNANGTTDPNYQIGCAEAATPTGFSNATKYSAPVLARTTVNGSEINTLGQPWVTEGPNGFEKWVGYFAIYTPADGGGRFQCVDRIHFFDKKLTVDGPTNRYTAGYHPDPAKPTLLNLFDVPDGPLPASEWTPLGAGTWDVLTNEARQSDQTSWSLNPVNRSAATNYLIEANVKFNAAADAEDKAGVLAYYQDAGNWMIVGIDRIANTWYSHRQEAGVSTFVSGALSSGWNHSVYHKIHVERNGTRFTVLLDDMIPPGGASPITTAITAAGKPGIYSDHSSASFDGVIYTIGWDEFDAGVRGWGPTPSGMAVAGTWTYGSTGFSQTSATGFNSTFKGDLMPQYEVETQVYRTTTVPVDALNHSMGFMPVAVDGSNYLGAEINLMNNTVFTYGSVAGTALTQQSAAVTAADNYNLRAVKLPDRVIIFVNGVEKLTINTAFGPSQVGLVNHNIPTRYNGILVYQTEPLAIPAPWAHQDIGTVAFPGSADFSDGTFVINGSGADFWDVADAGHFNYQPLTGDGEIVARVDSFDPTNWWAKCGLMFRENMTTNGRMVLMCISGGDDGNGSSHQFIWRPTAGGGTPISVHNVTHVLPTQGWMKLVRQNNTFSGYYSTNGTTWNLAGSCTVALPATAYVGLAVSATDNTRVSGGVFDNVSITSRPALILNGDFTSNVGGFVTFPGQVGGGSNPASVTHWTKTGTGYAGLNGIGTGAAVGNPFGPTDTGGRTYAFIQGGVNGLYQNITLATNTAYRLEYDVATRANNAANYNVEIDDATQTYFTTGSVAGSTAAFVHYSHTFITPGLLNGGATIKLWNLTSGDNTIDYANVTLAVAGESGVPPTAPVLRIMPLGDSITEGNAIAGGYRAPLQQLLANAGYNVDFVGTLTNNPGPLLDMDHEGHPGYRIDQIDSGVAGWAATVADPDVILLLIGTNDYGQDYNTSTAINRLDTLITDMVSLRPKARIVVANLIQRTDNATADAAILSTFNPNIPTIVNNHIALGHKVSFLDMRSGLGPSDLIDGLHFNQAGADKMAAKWFQAIGALISPKPTTTTLATNASPSTYGSAVTFTATVTSSAGTPTGSVTFKDGATVIGTAPLVGNVATLSISPPPPRSYSITATYDGVPVDFNASASNVVSQLVNVKPLTVSGVTAANKEYDGTPAATLIGTAALVGVVSGDTVTLGGTPSASFANANVGTAKPVTVTGYTLAGASAVNYSLTQPALSANITAAKTNTWTNVSGGSWATAANWNPGTVPNSTSGDCDFGTLNISGNQTVTLDGSWSTGSLTFADTSGANGNWTLAPGTAGTLTIAGPVAVTNQTATLDVVLAGTGGLSKSGSGTLTLTKANTYTGATTVSAGTLALVGGSQASPVTVSGGASLGFTLGSPTTSTSSFNLSAGTVKITGTPTSSSYTLIITSTGITGTPTLNAPISGYALMVDGVSLKLVKSAGYATWAATHAPTGTSADDFDRDGVSNGVEYVLGGSKLTNDLSKLPAVSDSGSGMVFSFHRDRASRDGSTTVAIEVGSDLNTWTVSYNVGTNNAASTPGVTVEENTPTGFDTVTLTVPRGLDGKKFARLVVTPAP
ncbi:MAG: family 43 glycosylhydrolase [Verrucomicrobiota bacterium]